MMFLEMRLAGHTVQEISEKFKVHVDTVDKWLSWAVSNGLLKRFEDDIIIDLVPLAMKVYREKLKSEDADPFMAKDILDKMIKLGDRLEARKQKQEELGLEAYLAERKYGEVAKNGKSKSAPADIDGTVVRVETVAPVRAKSSDFEESPSGDSEPSAEGT